MATPSVKHEGGSTPVIKPDPDTKDSSPGAMSEDDIYEDTGDLDFTNAEQEVWLTKIPRFLYDNWAKLDDDEEIQIGTVRVESGPTDMQRVRCSGLLLRYPLWRF
jgi:transcription initiation factor TFIIF subunit beta